MCLACAEESGAKDYEIPPKNPKKKPFQVRTQVPTAPSATAPNASSATTPCATTQSATAPSATAPSATTPRATVLSVPVPDDDDDFANVPVPDDGDLEMQSIEEGLDGLRL